MLNIKAAKPPIYFGWYIVATTMFMAFVGVGTRQGFGVFVVPMSDEFGWSRGTISLAASLGVLLNGAIQPFMGGLLDRFGGRKVVLLSLLLLGVSTFALAFTFNILFLIFVYGLVSSVALSGVSITTAGAMLSKWFKRRRATAMGLNAAGISIGGLLLVPFAMYLLQATNWRVTWAVLGLLVLGLALPLALIFLRDDPAKMGLYPDGDPAPPEDAAGNAIKARRGPLETDRWSDSLGSMPIWQMSASYFVCGATTTMLAVHFVPYALGLGISPGTAALAFGFMMGLNVIGGIAAGILSDRFSRKNLLALTYLIRGFAYILLLVVPGGLSLWVFAAVAGFSWIATAPLTTALTADVYGIKSIGTISGITFLFHAIGGFFSILMAGFLFDLTQSYTLPFAIAGALLFPAALSAFTIKERKYSMRYLDQATAPVAAGA
ncbi:MAG: MFS transporter [Chloroflexi bacterium]|nr:MFS transporter [Chloroflexota bacterium]MDA1220290.1 MFS transporter [Chloroflexota bacterium]